MTEEKSERKELAKKGLHGWKAAVTVFGCGTLAAFGVFGVIVGVLSLLINTASSGFSSPEEQEIISAQPAQPRQELEPGAMNLCDDYLPMISDVTIEEVIESSHSDDALLETFEVAEKRVASGACSFTVTPVYGKTSLWRFEFEFDATIYNPDVDRDEIASGNFEARVDAASEVFQDLESQGSHDWAGKVQSFYGIDDYGASQYLAIAQTRSATYQVLFAGNPAGVEHGKVPEFDFERQAKDLIKRLDARLVRVIPE